MKFKSTTAGCRLVYDPGYDIGFFGIERLHPFDTRKYSRAWKLLSVEFGQQLEKQTIRPTAPVSEDVLLTVHRPAYLKRLKSSRYLAQVLELPPVAFFPAFLTDSLILRPMRLATAGTIIAAQEALQTGFAANLSGGYHHAKPDAGEGFCVFSDIALAVHDLRRSGTLAQEDSVAYIDLDAHQGNGVCHAFLQDRRVGIFDIYNGEIYPHQDFQARERIDFNLVIKSGCADGEYLALLKSKLPQFLDSSFRQKPGFAIYNAGTDVYLDDPLGALALSADGVLQRDLFVIKELKQRNIATLMLPSGGYTLESHRMIYRTLSQVFREIHPLE